MTNLRQWWADPHRPADVRVSAALAWRYLGGDPVPDELRSLLTAEVTDELAESLADVPWMQNMEFWPGTGLRRSVRLILDPEDRQSTAGYSDAPPFYRRTGSAGSQTHRVRVILDGGDAVEHL